MDRPADHGSALAKIALWPHDENSHEGTALAAVPAVWHLAQEVAAAIVLDGQSVAVMMATPADLEDMGAGFLLSEGYFARYADFRPISVTRSRSGMCIDFVSVGESLKKPVSRAMEGRSGCGLCGVTSLSDIDQKLAFMDRSALDSQRVACAFATLARQQPMKARNHSVHGAGFCDHEGQMRQVREDVGRHNALDKLIGALARKGVDPASGFAVMTSRCSFELVRKAAFAGLGGLATLSAPTTLARDMARDAGLPLACRAPQGVAIFA